MAKEKSTIIKELHEKITSNGGLYQDWFVGISTDPADPMAKANNPCQYKEEALSSEIARDIKDYFVRLLNTNGSPSDGDESATWVYAYKMSAGTGP